MDYVRRAALVAIFLVMAAGAAIAGSPPGHAPAAFQPVALVTWPTSTLVVSEIQTGGSSASDEFFELANTGPAPVDLAGLEVVYVTATGGTITRKASWPDSQLLEPGRHLLVANSGGLHAAVADATYSGGLSATGGGLVLRPIGGTPIDAIGWGDATHAFVEGSAALAPPAGSSLERRPGGIDGNATDTNDNMADFFVQAVPGPQPLAAPPVPVPTPSATPAPPTSTPSASGLPSASPTSPPSAEPTIGAPPSPTTPPPSPTAPPPSPTTPPPSPTAPPPSPTTPPPSPTAPPPSPTAPPPSPTAPPQSSSPAPSAPAPSPTPTASPSPEVIPIADARALPAGTAVVVQGVLTTPLGLLEDGRLAFIEDAFGGIAIFLDEAPTAVIPIGTRVVVAGTLDERYGAVTLRTALASVTTEGPSLMPGPQAITTGLVGEELEGRRVTVTGATIGSSTEFADGTGLLVDDGSGSVRVIVTDAAMAGRTIPSGTIVTVVGPIGQRDSSGTGTGGYRILATTAGDLLITPGPSSSPVPSPMPSSGPSAAPTSVPTDSPPGSSPAPATSDPPPSSSPQPSPSASLPPASGLRPIAEVRRLPIGTAASVAGVVTAEAGRLGTPALFAIQDGADGLVVRLADGMAPPPRGSRVELAGVLADPFGQLELRLRVGGLQAMGTAPLPAPASVNAGNVGETTEGLLLEVEGSVVATPSKSTSNDISFDIVDTQGRRLRILADASSSLTTSAVRSRQTYRFTGVAGQRASRKGALDGYRLWLRDRHDIVPLPAPSGGGVGSDSGASVSVIPIRSVLGRLDATVVIQGVVTVPSRLLDATNRRIVVQDATAAIEVLLPLDAEVPGPGRRVRLGGVVGRAYGAPRLRASQVEMLAGGESLEPRLLGGSPGAALEWQLVRVSGTVVDVTRLGVRWRAELAAGGSRVLIEGLAGASIPSTSLMEGRFATVTGIVKRPYPGARDTRYSVVPRDRADVSSSGSRRTASGPTRSTGLGGPTLSVDGLPGLPEAGEAVDLGALAEHAGRRVRVGGLVVIATASGFTLDDGTAEAMVLLEMDAAVYRGLLEIGDAVSAVGQVVPFESGPGWAVVVRESAALVRVGELGEPQAIEAAADAAPEAGRSATVDAKGGPVTSRLGLDQLLVHPGTSVAGLLSLVVVSGVSLIAAVIRRRRGRAIAAVLASRLRRYAGPLA
jgi:hypothetical protein